MKDFALVPYTCGVSDQIKRILNNCDYKVALNRFWTLGHIFSKPKDPDATTQGSNDVYSLPCDDCKKAYLGQTKRQYEHQEFQTSGSITKELQRSSEHSLSQTSVFAVLNDGLTYNECSLDLWTSFEIEPEV